jgi:hypothetical protein
MARQKLPATAVAVSLALLTTGEHAVAQNASELETRLKAGTSSSRSPSVVPFEARALTPSFRYSSPHLKATGSASAQTVNQRWYVGDAEFAAEAATNAYHGIRAEILGNASRVQYDVAGISQQLDLIGRLHLIRENGGVWLGSGIVRPLRITTVSNVSVSSGGVWTKVGPATIRASFTNWAFTRFASNDSATATDFSCASSATDAFNASTSAASSCRRESVLTDLEGGVRWEHHRYEVSARGGHRFGQSIDVLPTSRTYGSAQAAVWLSSQLAAVGSAGREPAQPTRGIPARNIYSLGVMLAYWPIPRGAVLVESPANLVKAFEMRPAGVALQRLTARIGGVEKVEVMGDFSDWAPVPLVRRGRDHWELLLPMGAGVHHINMRIDGGKWIAPPGVPTIRDDFNGEVGVLVIKS